MIEHSSRRHQIALNTSIRLAGYFYEMYRPGETMVSPKKVIRVLNEAKVNFVLMGAHGVGSWRQSTRSTKDVDVLVVKRDIAKAVRVLHEAFPKLEVVDTTVVVRFVDPKKKESLIDVMKPVQTVFQMAFKHTVAIGETHRIPSLEMALVSKFAAMISPHRIAMRKMQDAADFMDIVVGNRDDIDLKKLRRLAEQTYKGGGKEILALVNDTIAGRTIRI